MWNEESKGMVGPNAREEKLSRTKGEEGTHSHSGRSPKRIRGYRKRGEGHDSQIIFPWDLMKLNDDDIDS